MVRFGIKGKRQASATVVEAAVGGRDLKNWNEELGSEPKPSFERSALILAPQRHTL